MSESGYTRINWGGTGVYIRTTHRPVIVELIKELIKMVPDLAATYTRFLDEENPHPMDIYRRSTEIRVSKLDNRDETVAFWFMQQLCQLGWEPLWARNDEFHLRLRA